MCCHANSAPKGASNWNVDKPGNFINGFKPRGIALGAGWSDSVGFGTFPPGENNGFHRPTAENPVGSIIPTTDPARMMAFFKREAAHRGLTREDFADEPYGGGPLDEQRFYVPGACRDGEGIDADGTIRWRFGAARYLYVLEAGAPSPTVPPNLDLPVGTLLRTDLPVMGTPIPSGAARYGQVPAGMSQRFPVQGAPPALVKGRQYYLYVRRRRRVHRPLPLRRAVTAQDLQEAAAAHAAVRAAEDVESEGPLQQGGPVEGVDAAGGATGVGSCVLGRERALGSRRGRGIEAGAQGG